MPYYLPCLLATDSSLRQLYTNHPELDINDLCDLITSDVCKLKLLAHHKKIHFKKFLQLRELLRDKLLHHSFSLIDNENNLCLHPLKCGSSALNKLLNKIPLKSVVEVFGPAGSGKSQLVFSIALESSFSLRQVLFVDCDLSFSKQRLHQMANHKYGHYQQNEIKSLLSLIRLYPIFNYEQLIDFLQSIILNKELHNSLVIIDSISSVLFANVSIGDTKNRKELHRKRLAIFAQFFEILKWTTTQANLHIVLTRLSTNELKFNWDSFLFADLSISLVNYQNGSIKTDIINRTCSEINSTYDITFEINNCGIY